MFRIDNAFFQINFIAAKRQFGFGFGTVISIAQIDHAVDHAHATAAAAVDCFEHDREADFFGEFFDFLIIHDRAVTTWNILNTSFFSLDTSIDFIAEHNQMFYFRTNKNNAFFFTAFCQVCIFGQETVARMDSINVVFMGNPDNIFNI